MSDVKQVSEDRVDNESRRTGEFAFGSGLKPDGRGGFPLVVWGAAALIAIIVVAALIYFGHIKPVAAPKTLQPADAYAASLSLSGFAMSESDNLSGGKLTYLDGKLKNTGGGTVTGVTVQVVFANDEAMRPEIDTVRLMLIAMKQPYIDVQPISANPLKPGDEREFRLTFDTIPENWNQEMPVVRVIQTDLR